MGVKWASRFDKSMKKKLKKFKDKFNFDLTKELKTELVNLIQKGRSPVAGFPNYKKYSDDYAKYKRKKVPVDLTDTGMMIGSLKSSVTNLGRVKIEFTDKKARYHQDGTDKMPMRRLLPEERGEEFVPKIKRTLIRLVRNALKLGLR